MGTGTYLGGRESVGFKRAGIFQAVQIRYCKAVGAITASLRP